jgi:hypothetical protein
MRWAIIVARLALAAPSAEAAGGGFTGDHLLTACKAFAENTPYKGHPMSPRVCVGVIYMAYDAARMMEEPWRSCPPGVSTIQAARVLTRYLETHPNMLHLEVKDWAYYALRDAWPCH